MIADSDTFPVVLTFSGSDATGGAGVQADIEAIASHGAHAATVITAITVQDTRDVHSYAPVDEGLVNDQARAVLEDIPVKIIKIGMLASSEIVETIDAILTDYPDIPVVLDPVLSSGAGAELADDEVIDAMRELLFPRTTILTPNTLEARALAPEGDTLEACAMALLDLGCEYVLVTGAHAQTAKVVNSLYGNRRLLETFTYERLAHEFHGSGCTLAASIAGLLAHGLEPFSAIHEAQEYTWETLRNAQRSGMGQMLPNRFFWAYGEDE